MSPATLPTPLFYPWSNCPHGPIHLAAILQKIPTLRILHLAYNNLGFLGITRLSAPLHNPHILVQLYLCGNNIDPTGATQLAIALKNKHPLRILGLQDNRLRPLGIPRLAQALPVLHMLDLFDPRWNNIGSDGVIHFANLLQKMPLSRILLVNNPSLRQPGINYLFKLPQNHPSASSHPAQAPSPKPELNHSVLDFSYMHDHLELPSKISGLHYAPSISLNLRDTNLCTPKMLMLNVKC